MSINAEQLSSSNNLLEVHDLKKYFPITAGFFRRTVGHVKAVDGISFTMKAGETLGIVGESGCGKSTTGRMIVKLSNPTSGQIIFDGKDISTHSGRSLRESRRKIQMVFQDPYASLNPTMTIGEAIAEPLFVNHVLSKTQAFDRAKQLLDTVGLRAKDISRHPHEFSGGQRQRVGIARALALNPKLIVADEAVSALDVSIQSQILNLLSDLRGRFNLSYLFISHNLAVVRHISDRVGVMYLGHMVEIGPKISLYNHPLHPYTQALLSAAPEPRRVKLRERTVLQGDVPSPANPPKGCPFHTRCPMVMDICREEVPQMKEHLPGHFAACHLHS